MAVRVIHQLTEAHILDLHELYQHEWWTQGRRLEDIRRMLAATNVTIACEDTASGQLIAFSRVLTDTVYRAHLFDVIVAKGYRGQGLGGRLVESVLEHPRVRVERIWLSCRPELVPFYEKWGFSTPAGPDSQFMLRQSRPAGSERIS